MDSSKTQVEGSLNAVLDDSSDEEENEEAIVTKIIHTTVTSAIPVADEDEEREVFTNQVEESKPQRRKSALIDAMQMSVKELETVHVPAIEESAPDMFGITYKPYGKPKAEYSMPTGPAFEDEAEFEKDLSVTAPMTTGHDEDDFDFEPVTNATTHILNKLQDALKTTEPEAVEINCVITTVTEQTASNAEAQEERINIFAASQAAFEDIAEVYRTGLGDHEVAIMQSSSVTLQDITLETGAIAEVDEEALAAQEEEEERAALEASEAEKRAKENLEKEWQSIDNAVDVTSVPTENSVPLSNKRITYKQAEAYFRALDLSEFQSSIVTTEEETSGFLKSIFSKREKLSFVNHENELELPFLIAQVAYVPEENEVHAQIMRGIFEFFTGISGVPLLGGHWESIGFQGTDPKTDINRSMKMLAALQVLHFVDTCPLLARRIFQLSNAQSSSGVDITWPFMCVAIMFTKHAIDELRLGHINKECNKVKSVLEVLHEVHHGCFVVFEKLLLSGEAVHHAVHLGNVKKAVSTNVKEVIADYRKEIENSKKNTMKKSVTKPPASGDDARFDNIGDMVEGGGVNMTENDQVRVKGKKFLASNV